MTLHKPVPTVGMFAFNTEEAEQIDESAPAFAIVVVAFSVTVIVSELDGQLPFEIVHTNEFTPTLKPVIMDVGLPGVVTVPAPAITVHKPVPVTGEFAAKFVTPEHTSWSGPAEEISGAAYRVMITSSDDGAHVPFEMVHRNIFTPTDKPAIPEFGEEGVVIVPVPAISVHMPVPTIAGFPASVAVSAHTN
jgi:hypothetical protein